MAEEIRLDVISQAHSEGLTKTAAELKNTRAEADKLGDSFDVTTKDAFDFDEQIEHTRARVKALREEFASGGGSGLLGELKNQRTFLTELERIRKEMESDDSSGLGVTVGSAAGTRAGQGFSGGFAGALRHGSARSEIIAGLVALVAAASPALGAMIAGAVVGTVAGGGIVGGIVAAAHDPRVKSEWKNFTTGLTRESFGSEAFVEPTIAGIQTLKQGLADLNLGEVLAQGAPAVETLAEGVVGFAKGILPGLDAAMRTSDKSSRIMADGFEDVGSAFGEMVRDLTTKEGTFDGLATLFNAITDAVKITHATVGFLTDAFEALLGPSEAAARFMQMITPWTAGERFFGDQADQIHDMREGTAGLVPQLVHLSEATMLNNAGLDPFVGYLKAATRETGEFAGALSELFAGQLSVDQATLAWKQDILDLKESVKEHGTTLADNTEEGLRNQQMIQGLVEDAMAVREATRLQTGSTDLANAAYMRQIQVLKDLLVQLGFSKQKIDELVGDYEINVRVNIFGAGSSGAAPQIIKNMRLEDKLAGGRASGGPVQAGGAYLIGERGVPEVLQMGSQSGHVYPSVGAYNSAMGGGSVQAQLSWAGGGGGSDFERWFVPWIMEKLRVTVRGYGGPNAAFS